MPALRGFPRQIAAAGLIVALLLVGGVLGWRLHARHSAGGDGDAALVMARVAD